MRQRIHYLPAYEARAGMVLAEDAEDRYLRKVLPAGHTLTDDNLLQLTAHRVELVCVSLPDGRPAEDVALDASTMARRVLDIFDDADLSDPTLAALFNQVLTYRSA